ncbi:uncharacterized protein LOC132309501 [Cornus florida]|uniref:uncharacterized protein LOC132309501 n=1 Tax=Cornus florida TaxID=4283 RepID=UPI00289C55C4|nr:uncharacterized protein LOC132309501 [Cornus florida]
MAPPKTQTNKKAQKNIATTKQDLVKTNPAKPANVKTQHVKNPDVVPEEIPPPADSPHSIYDARSSVGSTPESPRQTSEYSITSRNVDSQGLSYSDVVAAMMTRAAMVEEQLATISRAIETLTKTVEEKDLQIATLMNKLEVQTFGESPVQSGHPLVSLLALISSSIVSANPYNRPRLGLSGGIFLQGDQTKSTKSSPHTNPETPKKDFEIFFYNQTLDHFNYKPESYTTFQQRYVINSKYWGGAKENAPIFVYLGSESPLIKNETANMTGALLTDSAPRFKALLIYIEHRFYGKSVPFESFENAMKNATLRGYFNSAQAIADYATVITYLKEKFSARHSPVIVIGGSYGGMLATWLRLRYPHITLGALASSAPVANFHGVLPYNGYRTIVAKDFKEASKRCYRIIKKSWSKIDTVAARPNGLSILSQRFKTCSLINGSVELKDYLMHIYQRAAQYNHPPKYPVTVICGAIDTAPKGTDILGRIFAGVVANNNNQTCYDTRPNASQTNVGYNWQTCSEMVQPFGQGKETFFPPDPSDNLINFTKDCIDTYGVPPRPHWATTYFGGKDIGFVLQRFASNIIFSNGLRDPYSVGGVLKDISDSILSISTVNGSHCLDIMGAKPTDPDWLVKQRQRELDVIEGWIKNYFEDLSALKKIK